MNNQTTGSFQLPVYFDRMIDAFHAGQTGRHVHLGHWGVAECPARTHADFAAAQARMNSELITLSGVRNGTRILDVACGFGGLIQQLNQQLTDTELHGINIDDRQLEICRQLRPAPGNAMRWQEADACDLPFTSGIFDTVFCVEAMFHFASRRQFLAEAGRVRRPGGTLGVTDFTLTRASAFPAFCLQAILSDGYGPWPDPWCCDGSALELLQTSDWCNLRHVDATANTAPGYDVVVSSNCDVDHDPGDAASRSALLLQWLHKNGHLRYDYLTAEAGEQP